jgi:tryptophanyl-tRNA synthetase
MKKRLLTGDRPTGKLHLGHYVGSLKNRVALQDTYDSFIMVADIQALTDNYDNPDKVRSNVLEVVLDNLSVGVDPSRSTLFIQSQIPEIAELTVLYSNLVTVAELERNPTVKEEIQSKEHIFKKGNVTFGFLGYPVSQAADITFCGAHIVPVGEDQKPMLELTRKIVRKFNQYYGEILYEPKTLISEVPRLKGLDGRKMSKSFGNAIYLSDSEEDIREKIMKAKTDTDNTVRFEEENKPDISNLMSYYRIATDMTMVDIEEKFSGITSYRAFKESLAEELYNFLTPIREKRKELESDPDYVWDILETGRIRAHEAAKITMDRVRKGMKIDY